MNGCHFRYKLDFTDISKTIKPVHSEVNNIYLVLNEEPCHEATTSRLALGPTQPNYCSMGTQGKEARA
jgi:hypothetical protein